MFKLRKGDGLKAIVLILLIAVVGFFIYWTLKNNSRNASVARTSVRPTSVDTGPMDTTAEMFAPRPRATAKDVSKARTAGDPFMPEVSARTSSRRSTSSTRSSTARQSNTNSFGSLWLSGILSAGDDPLAVIRRGEERYFAYTGSVIANGWTVARIDETSVLLTKGEQKMTLVLGQQPASSPRLPTW